MSRKRRSSSNQRAQEMGSEGVKRDVPKYPVDVNVTFCTHVGWDGTLILTFMLVTSAVFTYITYLYTARFSKFRREYVWLFIALAGLFFGLVGFFLIRWRQIVERYCAATRARWNESPDAPTCFEKLQAMYNHFQVSGKYYLWQLYALEMTESIVQTNNVIAVYTCSLPTFVTCGLCMFLSVDCFHTFCL